MRLIVLLAAACVVDVGEPSPDDGNGGSIPSPIVSPTESTTTVNYGSPTVAYELELVDVEWIPRNGDPPITDSWVGGSVFAVVGDACSTTIGVSDHADSWWPMTLSIDLWFQDGAPDVGLTYVMPTSEVFAEVDRRALVPVTFRGDDETSLLFDGEVTVVAWGPDRWEFDVGGDALSRCTLGPFGALEGCVPEAGGTLVVTPQDESVALLTEHTHCLDGGGAYPWPNGTDGCVPQTETATIDCPNELWP